MARPSTRGGEFVASSALFVAVAVDFAAQQRRQLRLLGYEVVHFPCVVAKVVELLFPVLRRGDELVQLLPIAVEDRKPVGQERSEEHTSEPQSRLHLVCRLLLEK